MTEGYRDALAVYSCADIETRAHIDRQMAVVARDRLLDIIYKFCGLAAALATVAAALWLAAYLAVSGHPWPGGITGASILPSLAAVFLGGKGRSAQPGN